MEIKKIIDGITDLRCHIQNMRLDLRGMEGGLKQELISKGMVEFLNVNYSALHRAFIGGGEKKA